MKFHPIYKILLLFGILIIFQGCFLIFVDPLKEKYELINMVIQDLKEQQHKDLLLSGDDTLHLKRVVIDMNCRPRLSVYKDRKVKMIYLDNLSNEYLIFNQSFDESDLNYLVKQTAGSRMKFLLKDRIAYKDVLMDYSNILPNEPSYNVDLDIWKTFQSPEYNYCSLSEPVISSSHDRAIVGAVLCVSDYYLRKVFHLIRKSRNAPWIIDREIYLVGKVSREENSGRYKLKFLGSFSHETNQHLISEK